MTTTQLMRGRPPPAVRGAKRPRLSTRPVVVGGSPPVVTRLNGLPGWEELPAPGLPSRSRLAIRRRGNIWAAFRSGFQILGFHFGHGRVGLRVVVGGVPE